MTIKAFRGDKQKSETPRSRSPYFAEQEPSPCGHYYPDVLRVGDFKLGSKCFRMLNCICCGNYFVPISLVGYHQKMSKMKDATKFREAERIRLSKEKCNDKV